MNTMMAITKNNKKIYFLCKRAPPLGSNYRTHKFSGRLTFLHGSLLAAARRDPRTSSVSALCGLFFTAVILPLDLVSSKCPREREEARSRQRGRGSWEGYGLLLALVGILSMLPAVSFSLVRAI